MKDQYMREFTGPPFAGNQMRPPASRQQPHTFYLSLLGGALSLALGCATAGTRPHDMSADAHQGAASQVQDDAEAHAEKYDPSQDTLSTDCASDVCLPTWTNPTSAHRQEAKRLRRIAEKHRKAAEALREAENTACAEVNELDRDLSPFFHTDDIVGVSVPALDSDEPVEVTFGAVPGLTEESLQQLVDCHIARSASMGYEMSDMDYCPLAPSGVEASVATSDVGLVVSIRVAAGSESRTEVVRRAVKLEEAL